MNIDTTRQSNGNMATVTSGAGIPGGAGQLGEMFKALVARNLAKAPSAMGQVSAGFSQPERTTYQPSMGTSAPIKAGSRGAGAGSRKPRYSYQFTAPTQWAGNAPVLPMQTGLPGVEGEDFILEGGDVRALANMSRSGGGGSSPADDPRMRALVTQQEAARRAPAAPIAPVSRGAQSRGARA